MPIGREINKSRIEERYFKVILLKKSYLRKEIIAYFLRINTMHLRD